MRKPRARKGQDTRYPKKKREEGVDNGNECPCNRSTVDVDRLENNDMDYKARIIMMIERIDSESVLKRIHNFVSLWYAKA